MTREFLDSYIEEEDSSSEESENENNNGLLSWAINLFKEHWKGILLVIVTMAFFIHFRPWFHGLAMVPVIHPWFGVITLLAIGWLFASVYFIDSLGWWIGLTFTIWMGGAMIMGMFGGPFAKASIANTLDAEEIDDLPQMSSDYIRILPRTVGERYMDDSLQYPRQKLGSTDITMIDNTPHWSFPLEPNGVVNKFTIQCKGAAFVDMSRSSKDIEIMERDMTVGPGMLVADSVWWSLWKDEYWRDVKDPFPVPYKGELYYALPEIEYEQHFRFPVFYSLPKWGGVTLIDPEGNKRNLSPEEALDSDVLKGQQIFPYELARFYVEAQAYKLGVKNKWFHHENQISLTDVSGQGNKQPFLIKTEDGLKWFASVEPFGKAHGVFRVYIIDARTGDVQYWEPEKQDTLVGPNKAVDYVKTEYPTINWSTGSKTRGFNSVEPIPVIVDGELWWEIRVIPADSASVSKIVFLNAHHQDQIIKAETDKKAIEFQTAGEVIEIEEPTEENITIEEQVMDLIQRYHELQEEEESIVENIERLLSHSLEENS